MKYIDKTLKMVTQSLTFVFSTLRPILLFEAVNNEVGAVRL